MAAASEGSPHLLSFSHPPTPDRSPPFRSPGLQPEPRTPHLLTSLVSIPDQPRLQPDPHTQALASPMLPTTIFLSSVRKVLY